LRPVFAWTRHHGARSKFIKTLLSIHLLEKPHEDGPSYYPTVATISLGSHTVFHYYRYQDTEKESEHARSINPTPALSVLLEPRSVIITTSDLYTNYLHGIEDRDEDIFELDQDGVLRLGHTSTPIANQSLLTVDWLKTPLTGSIRKKRSVRYSLTCRDVARVSTFRTFKGR
jgi:alkylated DNA repair protein alkB family protein 6